MRLSTSRLAQIRKRTCRQCCKGSEPVHAALEPILGNFGDLALAPNQGTGPGDASFIQGRLTGVDGNKTLSLGRFLAIDKGPSSFLWRNLEDLVVA